MTWRLAKSLEVLRGQISEMYPLRSKLEDGTIGDESHKERTSDHNPWVRDGVMGVVTALDITHDPAHGVDSQKLAEALIASRDDRIKYVISNRKIASFDHGWSWRPYTGASAHDKHFHISVRPEKMHYDDEKKWKLPVVAAAAPVKPQLTPATPSVEEELELLQVRRGDRGPLVKKLQVLLNAFGAQLIADGVFGEITEDWVKRFQRDHDLREDGVVGTLTWQLLVKGP